MAGALLEKKAANALISGVEMRRSFDTFLRGETFGFLNWFLEVLRKRQGGLWVGGTLIVYEDRIQFSPNFANRLVQSGDMSFDLPWTEVSKISWRPGVLTGIIELSHAGKVEAVRCFGSKKLATRMTALRDDRFR